MMNSTVFFVLMTLFTLQLLVWIWKFFNWVWFSPKRIEKILRDQGFNGNPYNILYGDAREIGLSYKESYSKPIPPDNDIVPRILPFVTKTQKKYGSKSFMWIGAIPQIIIDDPQLIKEVMTKYTIYRKPFEISSPIVKSFIQGLIRYEGEEWHKSRKHLNPAFHFERMKLIFPSSLLSSEMVMNKWKKMMNSDGYCAVNVATDIEVYTGSVLSRTLFRVDYESRKKIFHLLTELSLLSNQAQPFNFPGQKYWPTKENRRAKQINNEIYQTFAPEIEERLKNKANGINREADMLDLLVDEYDENSLLSREDIINSVIGQIKLFHFAGFDTSSSLILWAIILLCMNPQWQARAREEAFQVLGDKKEVNYDDLCNLKILQMIVNEVLRLYPPIVELTRLVKEDTNLGEYLIPKDTMIMLPLIQLHRDKKIWGDDANEFNPNRFSQGALKATNGEVAYLPFGWGSRTCIGKNFSLLSSKLFMSTLLRTFTFELAPNYEHAPWVVVTLCQQFGANIILRKI